MAFMRGNIYVYCTVDGTLQIYCGNDKVALPWETAEELAVMICSEMSAEQALEVARRATTKHIGNIGCEPLAKLFTGKSFIDMLEEELDGTKEEGQ